MMKTATVTTQHGLTVGRFEFDDGGTYSGGCESDRAHGFGVCTGPDRQGEYAGAWQAGFETSGVYTWPNGNQFAGQWMQGKRHGLGSEQRGRWVYRGEWTQGAMGRYGVRQCTTDTVSKYEGTWTSGLQDGYGLETYSDGGTYQGQWMKGQRHGYGVRKSAMYDKAAKCRAVAIGHSASLTSVRSLVLDSDLPAPTAAAAATNSNTSSSGGSGLHHQQSLSTADRALKPVLHIGFYLTARCLEADDVTGRRSSFISRQGTPVVSTDPSRLALRRQRSAGDVNNDVGTLPGGVSRTSGRRDLFPVDQNAVEIYSGEWKADKRSGYGVAERSDGVKYEGEWVDNAKCGYGVTTYGGGPDVPGGWREEGRYKNNVLLSTGKKLFLPLRQSKIRERIDAAVAAAVKASQLAAQKSDIANSRMESARSKAELADQVTAKAHADADRARLVAKDVDARERRGELQTDAQRAAASDRSHQHTALNSHTMAPLSNALPSNHHPAQQQRHRHDYVEQDIRPVVTSVDGAAVPVEVGNDRIMYRDNSLPRRPRRLTSSQRPSPSVSRSSLSQTIDYSQSNHVTGGGRGYSDHVTPASSATQLSLTEMDASSYAGELQQQTAAATGAGAGAGAGEKSLQWTEQAGEAGHEGGQSNPAGLAARPSLRYRRDFHCPNLVIFNKAASRQDLVTVYSTSRVSAADEEPGTTRRPAAPPRRRLTMPSIVKYTAPASRPHPATQSVAATEPAAAYQPTVTEMFIVENCVRTRLEEDDIEPAPLPAAATTATTTTLSSSLSSSTTTTTSHVDSSPEQHIPVLDMISLDGLDPPKPLTKRFRVGRLVRSGARSELGSLPDISVVRQMRQMTPIPRSEATLLSQLKRQELDEMLEQQQQQQRRAIVLRLGDFKAWCERRQMLLFVSAVNAALIAAFYRLLNDY